MIEIFTLIGIFSILLYTTLYTQDKSKPIQEQSNINPSKLNNRLKSIESSISQIEHLVKGNQIQNLQEYSKHNKKIDTYTTTMNRLLALYEELSNIQKPQKKTESESEKIEKITNKLFEELNDLELNRTTKKKNQISSNI